MERSRLRFYQYYVRDGAHRMGAVRRISDTAVSKCRPTKHARMVKNIDKFS